MHLINEQTRAYLTSLVLGKLEEAEKNGIGFVKFSFCLPTHCKKVPRGTVSSLVKRVCDELFNHYDGVCFMDERMNISVYSLDCLSDSIEIDPVISNIVQSKIDNPTAPLSTVIDSPQNSSALVKALQFHHVRKNLIRHTILMRGGKYYVNSA